MMSIDEVWDLLRRGERQAAQVAALQLLDTTPGDPRAWSLAAEVADDPAWQAECWREVLRLIPDSRVAKRKLAALEGHTAQPTEADREALQGAILRARGGQQRHESPASSQAKVREVERRMLLRETSEQEAMRVIQLAGGPLPLEERRKCPHCAATISRRAARCEWCGRPV